MGLARCCGALLLLVGVMAFIFAAVGAGHIATAQPMPPDGVAPRSLSGHLDGARLVLTFSATIESRPAFEGLRIRQPDGRNLEMQILDGIRHERGRLMMLPGYLRLEWWPVEGEEPEVHGFDLPSPLPVSFGLESITPRQRETADEHPFPGQDRPASVLFGQIISRHAPSDVRCERDHALLTALGLATMTGRSEWVHGLPADELEQGEAEGNRRTFTRRTERGVSVWTVNDELGGAIERYTKGLHGGDAPYIVLECGPFREVGGVWVPERVEARWLYLGDDNPRAIKTVILEITPQRADRLGEMNFYTKWPEGSRIGIARRASRIVAVTPETAGRPIFFDDPPPQ